MYVKKRELEVITIEEAIIVYGLNLQGSGLPISFDNVG